MNSCAVEQKKENSFFWLQLPPLPEKPGNAAIRRRPELLSCFITAQPAHKFCAQPQATPCAPLCLYCHLYLENDSTLLCHRDVTNPLKTEMHLFTGVMGLLQVPE